MISNQHVNDKHIYKRIHTKDVMSSDTFENMNLSSELLIDLNRASFISPSPIQKSAIPIGLLGLDIIAQAKSGTGKTLVFTIILLQHIKHQLDAIQALILAPTREIAIQINSFINTLNRNNIIRSNVFIGSIKINVDKKNVKKCHIAVGTPGRIKALISSKILIVKYIHILVLDEADQLLDDNFLDQTKYIMKALPKRRQNMFFSATFTDDALNMIHTLCKQPIFINESYDEKPSLLGVKQFVGYINGKHYSDIFENKVNTIINILSTLEFHQCIIFSNQRENADELSNILRLQGWPSVCIGGERSQKERNHAMHQIRNFMVRIIISTDLIARGVDVEKITLVINFDLPLSFNTYLHRVGRTGRFGTLGVAITLQSKRKKYRITKLEKNLDTKLIEFNLSTLNELKDIPSEYLALNENLTNDKDIEKLNRLQKIRLNTVINDNQIINVEKKDNYQHKNFKEWFKSNNQNILYNEYFINHFINYDINLYKKAQNDIKKIT